MTVIFSNLKISLVFICFGVVQIFSCPDECKCHSTKVFDCSNLKLEHFPKGFYQFVERLDLSGNSFFTIPEEIRNLRHLKFLNFSNNRIEFLGENPLARLRELKVLDLSRNNLNEVSVESFKENPRLRYLNLAYNKLSHAPAMPARVLVVVSRDHLTLNEETGTVFISGNSSRNRQSSPQSDVIGALRLKRDNADDNNDLGLTESAGSSVIILLLILIAAILIGGTVLQVRAKRKKNGLEAAKPVKMTDQPNNPQQQTIGINRHEPPVELSLEKILKQELNFGNQLLFPYPPTAPMHFRTNLT